MKRLLLTGIAAFGLTAGPAQAVLIDFATSSFTGPAGTSGVDIVVSDLGDEIVSAFGILVDYGPLTLDWAIVGDCNLNFCIADPDQAPQIHAYSQLSDGFPLGNFAYTDFQDIPGLIGGLGTVYLEDVSLIDDATLAAIQPNEFILGSLFFLSEDPVDLSLLSFIWDVSLELDVKGLNAEVIYPTSDVPEPGTLFLLGSGLIGFGLSRRRRARS
jgi:hypothetical protein